MARKILAAMMVLLGVSASAAFLSYAPAHITLSVIDPPPEQYSSSIQAIWVTFSKVEIHAANAAEGSGWHELSSSSKINLFTALNASKVLGGAQVPAGKYTEIRFFAGEAIVTVNGSDTTYTIPSGAESGIKVVISGGGLRVYGGQGLEVQLDVAFKNSDIMDNLDNPVRILRPVVAAAVV